MKREYYDRYLTALRTTSHPQTIGMFGSTVPHWFANKPIQQPPGFCAVGLLCQTIEELFERQDHEGMIQFRFKEGHPGEVFRSGALSDAAVLALGMRKWQVRELTVWNDRDGLTFAEIADRMEMTGVFRAKD